MKVALFSAGSFGDVLPMITLARSLHLRGHEVTLMSASFYPDEIDTTGIEIIPLGTIERLSKSWESKWLLNTRYSGLYIERFCLEWNVRAFELLRGFVHPGTLTITVDRPQFWADLLAFKYLRTVPLRLQLDLPPAPHGANANALPPTRVQRYLFGRCDVRWRHAAKAAGIDAGTLGLERLWRATRKYVPTLSLWPDWLLKNSSITTNPTVGFMPAPAACTVHAAPIDEKRPLIVFVSGTEGTTHTWTSQFAQTSGRICEELQAQGILLCSEDLPPSITSSNNLVCSKFFPLDQLLPLASAIVHHGGIGTAAASIASGVPQVVIPRVFAQAANAEWLRRLGLCEVVQAKNYTIQFGKTVLRNLLTNEARRHSLREFAGRCDCDKSVQRLCEYAEERFRQCLTLRESAETVATKPSRKHQDALKTDESRRTIKSKHTLHLRASRA